MLRLSSLPFRILPLLFLFWAAVVPVCGKTMAFLLKGPVQETGIPFIYPNALPSYKGYYQYGNQRVTVFFTSGLFLVPGHWKREKCGRYKGYRFTDTAPVETSETSGSAVFYYKKDREQGSPGWSLFLCFPEKIDCVFVSSYIERLEYFQRNNDPSDPPLLPAVVAVTR